MTEESATSTSWQDDPSVQFAITHGSRAVHDPSVPEPVRKLLAWTSENPRRQQDLRLGLGALLSILSVTGITSADSHGAAAAWAVASLVVVVALLASVVAPAVLRARYQKQAIHPQDLAPSDGVLLALGARRADEAVEAAETTAGWNTGFVPAQEVRRSVEADLWGAAELLKEASELEEDLDELGVAKDDPRRDAVAAAREAAKKLLQAVADTHQAARELEQRTDPRWALLQDRVDVVHATAQVSLEGEPATQGPKDRIRTFDQAVKDLEGPTAG